MSQLLAAWVNGQPAVSCDLSDRAVHYGDGLFETFAVSDGRPEFCAAHLERLNQGCRRLYFPPPDLALLQAEAHAYSAAHPQAVLKLIYTRGDGGRGYAPPVAPQPRRIWLCYAWPEGVVARQQQGVALRVCQTRYASQPQLAGLKHLNRLEQVLARAEWQDPSIGEGLMLDFTHQVVSGTMSNLFFLKHDELRTPPLTQCGIAGVIRAQVLALAPSLGLRPVVTPLTLADLAAAEALFLTNSVIRVWPVQTWADHRYTDFTWAARFRAALAEVA